jgi:hypothetical protein
MDLAERDAQQRALLADIADQEAADARLFAARMRNRAELDRLWNSPEQTGPEQFGVLELAGTARIGQIRADSQLSTGRRLVDVFPATLALLEQGLMYRETAVLLLELTRNCTEPVQAEVEQRVLAQIATANTADVRRIVTATIPEVEADLDPALTQQRLDAARRERRVWISPQDDATCQIGALLETLRGRRWALDFEELVRAQKIADQRAGIVRTQDQRRADVFAELPGRLRALIHSIQTGNLTELLALAHEQPHLTDELEELQALADTLPMDPDNPADHPTEAVDTAPSSDAQAALFDQPAPDPTADRPLTEPEAPALAETLDRLSTLSVEELTIELLQLPVRDPQVLNVHIPMSTVLDLDHRSGYLEGHGPIPAEQARLMLPVTGLRRLFVDAHSGVPLALDPELQPALIAEGDVTAEQVQARLLAMLGPTTIVHRAEPRHDPSAALQALINIRDLRCIGIGCSCPAPRAHKDHELRYPEGPTAPWNLSAKSTRCHRAKHAGWTVTRHDDGTTHWTSPLGHTYTRPGVWQTPTPLPATVTLPPARLAHADGHDPHPHDLPFLPEPEPDPDTPQPRAKSPTSRTWSDEPPPF